MTAIKKPRRQYKTADGKVAPGVTTVLGVLDRPALLGWAYRAGLDAVAELIAERPLTLGDIGLLRETPAYLSRRDAAANAGSYAHDLVACALTGETPDDPPEGFGPSEIEQARACADRLLAWLRHERVEIVAAERPLISEIWRVGGTPDLIGRWRGQLTVVDFKTGKRPYDEVIVQLGAYRAMAAENGFGLADCGLVLSAPIDGERVTALRVGGDTLERAAEMFAYLTLVYRGRQALTLKKHAETIEHVEVMG